MVSDSLKVLFIIGFFLVTSILIFVVLSYPTVVGGYQPSPDVQYMMLVVLMTFSITTAMVAMVIHLVLSKAFSQEAAKVAKRSKKPVE